MCTRPESRRSLYPSSVIEPTEIRLSVRPAHTKLQQFLFHWQEHAFFHWQRDRPLAVFTDDPSPHFKLSKHFLVRAYMLCSPTVYISLDFSKNQDLSVVLLSCLRHWRISLLDPRARGGARFRLEPWRWIFEASFPHVRMKWPSTPQKWHTPTFLVGPFWLFWPPKCRCDRS